METQLDVPLPEADPYRCRLNLASPPGKEKILQKIISPLIKWIDPSFQIIRIVRSYQSIGSTSLNCRYEVDHDADSVRTPALSVMLFLSENGIMCSNEVQKHLRKRPWKFHHKVELQCKRSPDRPAASQEFYGIADDLPLWSVCPIHCGNEHLRFLFHVRNFREMVEFYRVITEVEMESNKPGFCIFQLYSQPGLDIQLALKHSNHISPYPVKNAILNFKVKNLATIRTYLKTAIIKIGSDTYSITDPDGNTVYLQELQPLDTREMSITKQQHLKHVSDDVKSVRSSSDSHDSGRCSDSEIWFSEVELSKGDLATAGPLHTNGVTMKQTSLSDKFKLGFNAIQNEADSFTKYPSDTTRRRSTERHQSKMKVESVYL